MAESGIKEIGVDLIKDSVEVISNCPNSDSWSLGCDITIDDVNAELQEIRVADIILSGNITTGEIAVDIDSQKEVIDLGISAIVNGINSALTESQIVPYEDILKITTISPEATNETRYASSAFSAKAIYDLITFLGRRVDTLESTNEQGGVINKDVADRLDKLEKNQFFERYDDQTIKTKYNLFSDHEISAFGLNAGTGGGSGGEGGASYLKDLWDVTIVSAANDDILVYNGTHWVNKPQSSIMPDLSVLNNYLLKTEAAELYLVKDAAKDFASASSVTDLSNALVRLSETYGNRLNALEKIVQWFHLTQDEQAIYTEKNFYSEKEISAHGLNLGGGSGEGGAIELGNIIGVSLHSPVTGDVFVYNGTHWTNISQSELVPDLSGYATTDSVSTVSNRVNTVDNKVKSLEDRLNDLESEKLFFKLEGADDVIYTPYNLFSEKEISAHGLNYGSGSGASGLLTDLLDVKAEDSTSGDLLVFDGTHWINTPQSAIVPSIDTSVIATREWVGQNYASTSDLSNGVKDAKAYTDALRTHVNKQDQILSGQIAKILDWFTLEDGVLLTKYNLASEKEVSAKGINASQGGGTSYNRLDSWSAYDSSKAGYVLSALLGYDLHSRVTTLENAEVDLSDYYTKSQTNSQIASAIGAIDLNPYATKAALNILEGKHNTLRNEFDALNNLLSSDTTDYINTWNEVVAFLDGYKDESDLATILSGMNADISSRLLTSTFESWKTNTFTPLANLVANHTTRLNGIDTSITNINTRIDGVDKTIEDHIAEFIAFRANFEISDDLILVRKNFASTEEVSAKGINQGTGGGGGSSYSRLDTWEGYDNNKAGYVLSAGLGYGLKVAIDELNGYDLDNRVRSIENSYVSKDAGGVVNGGLVVSSLAIAGGSSSQFLKADGSLDSTSYLPTSGGKIAVNSGIQWGDTNNVIYATASTMHIDTDSNLFINGKQVIHEGNIGYQSVNDAAYAKYLSAYQLTDITNLDGTAWYDWNNQLGDSFSTYTYGILLRSADTNIFTRIAGCYSDASLRVRRFSYSSDSGWKQLAFLDDNVASATKLATARTIWGQSFDGTGNVDGDIELLSANKLYWADKNNYYIGTSYTLSNDGLNLDYRAFAGHVFMSSSGIVRMLINSSGNVTIGTSDLAGTSYKLRVDGDVALTGELKFFGRNSIQSYNSTALSINPQGNDILLNQNGYNNVGIGTASPSYKLDVIGDIRATESITIGGATLSWENGALKVNTSFYSEKEISAKGLSTGGGSGASYNRLDAWGDYDSSKAGYVLSAYLGDNLNTRLSSLSGVVDTHTSRLSSLENAGYITSSALSGYLPTSGGTIKGSSIHPLTIDTYGEQIGIYFSVNGSIKTEVGWDGINGAFLYNYVTGDQISLTPEGEAKVYINRKFENILHTGNVGEYAITPSTIGSQSVAYATNAGGIQGSTSSINFALGHNRLEMINNISDEGGDFATGYQSGISVITEYVGWQMTSYGGRTENPFFRSLEETGRWKPWRQLAFIDDNVASATKLATPRTIWGQSFDGTGNVGGDLSDVTFLKIRDYDYGIYKGNYFGGLAASDIVFTAPNLYFYTSKFSMFINSSGNVGIGTTDPKEKLDVDSTFRVFNATNDVCLLVSSTASHVMRLASLNTAMSAWYAMSLGYNNQLYLNPASTKNNYVGINTDNPIYQLHVDGSGYFSGALTANGGLTVNGILSVGNASIHPANGTPYFQLYQNSKYWYWQADNNYTYIGGTMSKALRIDQDGNTLIRGSLGVTGDATANRLVVGTDGISCNGPATFNDFIYGSSITPRTDNYYVLGNNNYKWYAVTAYNVNVHDAITIEAGKELRFKDNNGVVHTLKYDSAKQAFVFDGNVNATGEMSAKKLNA